MSKKIKILILSLVAVWMLDKPAFKTVNNPIFFAAISTSPSSTTCCLYQLNWTAVWTNWSVVCTNLSVVWKYAELLIVSVIKQQNIRSEVRLNSNKIKWPTVWIIIKITQRFKFSLKSHHDKIQNFASFVSTSSLPSFASLTASLVKLETNEENTGEAKCRDPKCKQRKNGEKMLPVASRWHTSHWTNGFILLFLQKM